MRLAIYGLLLVCSLACGEVYRWTDEKGKIHYSDKPTDSKAQQVKVEIFNTYSTAPYTPIKAALSKNVVVMFSAEWCEYCKKANKFFTANNIAFLEVDIDKDQAAKNYFNSIGGTGLPVILYKNRKVTGFSEASFREIYK
jgi:glutaredoxin